MYEFVLGTLLCSTSTVISLWKLSTENPGVVVAGNSNWDYILIPVHTRTAMNVYLIVS